jgi:hypothetical protein
MLLNL